MTNSRLTVDVCVVVTVALTVIYFVGLPGAVAADANAAAEWSTDGLPRTESNASVKAGKQAFETAAKFPWYDAATDSRRAINLPASGEPPASPDWVAKPRQSRPARKARAKQRNGPPLWSPQTVKFLQLATWCVLAVLIGAIIYYWLRMVSLAATGATAVESFKRRTEAELIEQLPFQVKRPTSDLLAEATRHYELGNYNEAIVYLYSHQLVQLDRSRVIEIDKGKTNRQYLAELRDHPTLSEWLTKTMLAFEDVFFGRYTLSADRFEGCWSPLASFHQTLEQLRSPKKVTSRT